MPSPAGGLRERRATETRRTIIDAARRLFEEHGYGETTVERIAEQAEVAPRTFFRYFPTKETLLFADFDDVRRQMLDELEARPIDEHPLTSLRHALDGLAAAIEDRRDDLVWGFEMCAEQNVEGVYERTMLKEHSNARVASFIAERLGVDEEQDPRPITWTMAIMAVFGASMKFAVGSAAAAADGPGAAHGGASKMFDEMLESTADAFRSLAGDLTGAG